MQCPICHTDHSIKGVHAEVERLTAANERLSSLHEHGEVAMAKTIKELRAQLANVDFYTTNAKELLAELQTAWAIVKQIVHDDGDLANIAAVDTMERVLKGAAPPAVYQPLEPLLWGCDCCEYIEPRGTCIGCQKPAAPAHPPRNVWEESICAQAAPNAPAKKGDETKP